MPAGLPAAMRRLDHADGSPLGGLHAGVRACARVGSPGGDNYVRASRYGATPKAKLGGGSCLLCFEVRAAPQRSAIQVPTAADASDPTSYLCHHSPSLQAVCGELSLDCDKALRAVLTKVK